MARKCFEYRGFELQSLKGDAVAVWETAEGKRARHRIGVPIKPEAAARTRLMAWVDFRLAAAVGGELTTEETWHLFIADKKADQKPTATDEARWVALGPWFGHLKPSQITDQICRDYAKERFKPCVEMRRMRNGVFKEIEYPNGRAPDTVWTELVTLQAALSWGLKKHHWSLPNGQSHEDFTLWRPARSEPRDRAPSRDEVEKLIAHAQPDSHVKLFIMIAAYTGARKSAVLELKWDQVDLDNGIIDFKSTEAIDPMSKRFQKGRATVSIGSTLRAVLRIYQEKARSKYVIEYAGQKVDDVKTGFNKAAMKAGLWDKSIPVRDRVTPHSLRHAVATWLEDDGIDEKTIQEMLGHKPGSKVTRKVYIAKKAERTKGAADTLDRGMARLKVVK